MMSGRNEFPSGADNVVSFGDENEMVDNRQEDPEVEAHEFVHEGQEHVEPSVAKSKPSNMVGKLVKNSLIGLLFVGAMGGVYVVTPKLLDLATDTDVVNTEFSDVSTQVDSLSFKLESLEGLSETYATRENVTVLSNSVMAIENAVASLQDRTQSIEGAVNRLEDYSNSQRILIVELQQAQLTQQANLDKVSALLDEAVSSQKAFKKEQDAIKSAVAPLKERLDKAVKNISASGSEVSIKGDGKAEPQVTSSYTVKRGDNLYRIALIHNTSVDTIRRLNSLGNNWVYVGQTLKVPSGQQQSGSVNQNVQPSNGSFVRVRSLGPLALERVNDFGGQYIATLTDGLTRAVLVSAGDKLGDNVILDVTRDHVDFRDVKTDVKYRLEVRK